MNVGMLRSNWDIERESDQKKGLAQPDMQKAAAEDAVTMDLDPLAWKKFRGTDLTDAIIRRRSERRYSPAPISLDELSWLLYAIQGLQEELPRASKRTAASAGARLSSL